MKISAYWKGLIAGLGPVILAAQAAVDDGHIDSTEWVTIAVAGLVWLGVIAVPNKQANG